RMAAGGGEFQRLHGAGDVVLRIEGRHDGGEERKLRALDLARPVAAPAREPYGEILDEAESRSRRGARGKALARMIGGACVGLGEMGEDRLDVVEGEASDAGKSRINGRHGRRFPLRKFVNSKAMGAPRPARLTAI